ncbi:MAG TPA: TRAP transporter small permease [Ramlibacter sp.]|nr:TRAP transporter small permease [Ramlibacter sp.]
MNTPIAAPADGAPVADRGAYFQSRRGVDAIDAVLVTIGSLMLFALMCLVVADVSLRYIFNSPLQWSYEVITNYLMPGLFFLAVSDTLKSHSHVAVDIVHNYIKPKTRYVLQAIVSVVAVPAFAVTTWYSAIVTLNDFETRATSTSGLPVLTWTLDLFLPIGFGLLTIRLFLDAIGYIMTLSSGRAVLALPPISGTEGAEEGAE